ncbi:toll/interleukin-1 receptor domain-containing protein [Streptomyces sp. NBC_01210]|uniref:toll/interleukin-1 receptor domain-containing protein n=1 Tax=Streptomyces sp. NBC_01210 TaxID=2903774 RepID=UPI002E0D3BAC|nr:toll/interleukin-1 receptor domain-containing protein [Streptomyces sp. NBC_01210]
MRILVLGSLPDHVPGANQPILAEHAPLFRAGRALGWALAAGDFRAIIGSSSQRTIDPYIFEGYAEYCRENPSSQRHIEIQFPVDAANPGHEPRFADAPENLHVMKIENYADASSPHRWIVSHFAALRSADLLIVLGGGVSTRLLGAYAASNKIPTLAIREYGGSSAEVFLLARHTYQKAIPRLGERPTRETSQKVISFAVELVKSKPRSIHSYFLSYSWNDCPEADYVEVLLRRFGRMIFRDEDRVMIGHRIPRQLEASIQEADTFVALFSNSYNASQWCPSELEFALESQASGRPDRIVLIELDETKPPLRAASLLRVKGNSREHLDLCVRRMIEQE